MLIIIELIRVGGWVIYIVTNGIRPCVNLIKEQLKKGLLAYETRELHKS